MLFIRVLIDWLFAFSRCFGPKCGGCGEKIHYQDFVRKARDKVYHLRCFTCSLCSKQLSTGEVLYLQPGDEGFVCKDHYLNKGKTKKNLHYLIIVCTLELLLASGNDTSLKTLRAENLKKTEMKREVRENRVSFSEKDLLFSINFGALRIQVFANVSEKIKRMKSQSFTWKARKFCFLVFSVIFVN